ncbi:hypothetical protein [Pseudoduganella sp. OTU4001]|uniref:hypothetical protein n=1 Tax=Pseudoduganella sp. OTU4001 TaxID=3043854 RepID=UPI00313B417B
MFETVKAAVMALLILQAGPVIAKDRPPKMLRDPLLGLRYDRTLVSFEHLPKQVLAPCPTLAERESIKSHWYVFAKVRGEGGEIYYLAAGYSVRAVPYPPEIPKYDLDDAGIIFSIKDDTCIVFEEPARDMFGPNLEGEIPEPVLLALANDHKQRLTQAFAGSAQLKTAMKRQRIAIDKLPPALREAYSAILK